MDAASLLRHERRAARTVNVFFRQLAQLGAARLIVMFGVAAGVAAALVMISSGVGTRSQSLLFANLSLAESAQVAERLEQAGLTYEMRAGGTAIFVDSERVLDARLMLAADGLPGSGSVGYEIFDSQDALGATQFVQNVNRIRALEGELARTIARVEGVASARVHLAIPERRLFDREASEPTASVFLELRGGALGARNARAVRNLVASAVPGLKSGRVTILDAEGRLLHDGAAEGEDVMMSAAMEERKVAYEERLRRRLLDLVESVVGLGNARIQVNAEMDFNRITERQEIFDPAGQVVRSTRTEENTADERDREDDGQVGAAQNVPDLAEAPADGSARTSESASRGAVEVINYEISKRTRNEIREVGAVTRLSVAVAVNFTAEQSEEGAALSQPRTAQEMEQIAALVRSAIGFDAARGDTVEVVNVAFAAPALGPAGTAAPPPMSFTTNDVMRALELLVLAVVAVMVILLVARPLLKAAGGGGTVVMQPQELAAAGPAAIGAASDVPAAPGGPVELMSPDDMDGEEMIEVANISGALKASSVTKVSKVVQQHQDKSVALLRNWLHEG